MGQALTVANATESTIYVKVQDPRIKSEKTEFGLGTGKEVGPIGGKVEFEFDSKDLEPGFVAIDAGKTLRFARNTSRQYLSVKRPGVNRIICDKFLVPYGYKIIVTPSSTIRYTKKSVSISQKTWTDIDGIHYSVPKTSSTPSASRQPSSQFTSTALNAGQDDHSGTVIEVTTMSQTSGERIN